MKIFLFCFKGMWMGGHAVIVAKSKKNALKILQTDYSYSKLSVEDQKILDIQEFSVENESMIYMDNGDY